MKYSIEVNQRVRQRIGTKWIKKIVQQTLRVAGIKSAEISIAFIGDQEMKKLNKKWRGRNRVTDVLSFTYQTPNTRDKIPLIGEIIICYPQAKRQAKEQGHSVQEEIKVLLVHGLLHLCGYEHENGLQKARRMRGAEQKALEKLKNL